MESSKLDYYLGLWSDYMRSSSNKNLWYPSVAGGFSSSQSSRAHDELSEIIEDSVQSYELGVMIGIMDSIPKLERIALEFLYINQRAGAAVFSHPMLPKEFDQRMVLTERAKATVERHIKRKGMLL